MNVIVSRIEVAQILAISKTSRNRNKPIVANSEPEELLAGK